ncbi:hypothetical protein Tco_0332666 [Tanacetum coccineum]
MIKLLILKMARSKDLDSLKFKEKQAQQGKISVVLEYFPLVSLQNIHVVEKGKEAQVTRLMAAVPRSVQLNAGRPNINSVRPNINTGRTNINSVMPNINTGRTNINSVRPNINTGRVNVNSVRPNVNTGRTNVNPVRALVRVNTSVVLMLILLDIELCATIQDLKRKFLGSDYDCGFWVEPVVSCRKGSREEVMGMVVLPMSAGAYHQRRVGRGPAVKVINEMSRRAKSREGLLIKRAVEYTVRTTYQAVEGVCEGQSVTVKRNSTGYDGLHLYSEVAKSVKLSITSVAVASLCGTEDAVLIVSLLSYRACAGGLVALSSVEFVCMEVWRDGVWVSDGGVWGRGGESVGSIGVGWMRSGGIGDVGPGVIGGGELGWWLVVCVVDGVECGGWGLGRKWVGMDGWCVGEGLSELGPLSGVGGVWEVLGCGFLQVGSWVEVVRRSGWVEAGMGELGKEVDGGEGVDGRELMMGDADIAPIRTTDASSPATPPTPTRCAFGSRQEWPAIDYRQVATDAWLPIAAYFARAKQFSTIPVEAVLLLMRHSQE